MVDGERECGELGRPVRGCERLGSAAPRRDCPPSTPPGGHAISSLVPEGCGTGHDGAAGLLIQRRLRPFLAWRGSSSSCRPSGQCPGGIRARGLHSVVGPRPLHFAPACGRRSPEEVEHLGGPLHPGGTRLHGVDAHQSPAFKPPQPDHPRRWMLHRSLASAPTSIPWSAETSIVRCTSSTLGGGPPPDIRRTVSTE